MDKLETLSFCCARKSTLLRSAQYCQISFEEVTLITCDYSLEDLAVILIAYMLKCSVNEITLGKTVRKSSEFRKRRWLRILVHLSDNSVENLEVFQDILKNFSKNADIDVRNHSVAELESVFLTL
jgi:hypothetical protein